MADRCSVARNLAILLSLTALVHAPLSFAGESPVDETAARSGGFQYSDDWKIVSAPPPPGPYATVNVDPRVPGQDITRPVPGNYVVTEPADQMPGEIGRVPPPGAGRPAASGGTRQLRSRPAYTAPPPAGAYGRQDYGRYSTPGYNAPGYPDYQRRQRYPGYGQGYNQGYGNAYPGQYAPYQQQDIPPPPYAVIPGR